jgi:hypothetical protein
MRDSVPLTGHPLSYTQVPWSHQASLVKQMSSDKITKGCERQPQSSNQAQHPCGHSRVSLPSKGSWVPDLASCCLGRGGRVSPDGEPLRPCTQHAMLSAMAGGTKQTIILGNLKPAFLEQFQQVSFFHFHSRVHNIPPHSPSRSLSSHPPPSHWISQFITDSC